MRARAPGKLVLSGAYAVLEGATALVAAVDRYVLADSARAPDLVTPEVRAAIGDAPAPWFDAAALREGGQKLGLGSSAAILVASLGALALEKEPGLGASELAERVFARALAAHAEAQGGGSGIDVAASTYGGVLAARRTSGGLALRAVTLPSELRVHVLSLGRAASTPELIGRVRALRERDPTLHTACLAAQAAASEAAVDAVDAGDAPAFVRALRAQTAALTRLGEAAGAPIVTSELRELEALAEQAGAALLPSGAGGGDVALWVSLAADAPAPENLPVSPLKVGLGAPGLHPLP